MRRTEMVHVRFSPDELEDIDELLKLWRLTGEGYERRHCGGRSELIRILLRAELKKARCRDDGIRRLEKDSKWHELHRCKDAKKGGGE